MPRPLKERLKYAKAFEGVQAIWNKYDPIGVSDQVDDEYDSYVVQGLKMLMEDKEIEDIANYYEKIVTQWMCLNCERTQALSFAKDMKDWWKTSQEGLMIEEYH